MGLGGVDRRGLDPCAINIVSNFSGAADAAYALRRFEVLLCGRRGVVLWVRVHLCLVRNSKTSSREVQLLQRRGAPVVWHRITCNTDWRDATGGGVWR